MDETYGPTVAIVGGMRLRKKVRLFGVSLSALVKDHNQLALFHNASRGERAAMTKAVHTVNDKSGEHSIHVCVSEEKGRKVIFSAWRPV